MKLRLLTILLLLTFGITNFSDAMKRGPTEESAAEDTDIATRNTKRGGDKDGDRPSPSATTSSDQEQNPCLICFNSLNGEEVIKTLPCTHCFHSSCIDQWIAINPTCPCCRAPVPGVPTTAAPLATDPLLVDFIATRMAEISFISASELGDTARVLELINMGVNVNTRDSIQQTAMHRAASHNHIQVMQILTQYGADINAEDPLQWHPSPLHKAIEYNQFEAILFLVNNGANINAQDDTLTTPLHLAAATGLTAVVEFLLSRSDLDPTRTNFDEQTAADVACTEGIKAMIQARIASGSTAFGELPTTASESKED